MQIRELQIDRFGIFNGYNVRDIAPGLNVLYGKNEFGKTTLLEFVRWILFGFPSPRNKNVNVYEPVNGGTKAGKLVGETRSGDIFTLIRDESQKKDGVRVRTQDEERAGKEVLTAYLGPASRTVFTNIFAFTLDELHDFDSLRHKEIENKIYAAGTGMGNVEFFKVFKELMDTRDALFTKQGKKQEIHNISKEIDTLKKHIRDIQKELSSYDAMEARIAKLEENIAEEESRIEELKSARRTLEIRDSLLGNVTALFKAQEDLDRLPEVNDFPESCFQKFEHIRNEQESLNAQLSRESAELGRLENQFPKDALDPAIRDREEDVKRLNQKLDMVSNAVQDQPGLQIEQAEIEDSITEGLRRLGPGWDESRVREFLLTEPETSQLQQLEAELKAAQTNLLKQQSRLEVYQDQKNAGGVGLKAVPAWLKALPWTLAGIGLLAGGAGWSLGDPILGTIVAVALILLGLGLGLGLRRLAQRAEWQDPKETRYREDLQRAETEVRRLESLWMEWLRKKELDTRLDPSGLGAMLSQIHTIQGWIRERTDKERRLQEIQAKLDEAAMLVQSLATALGVADQLGTDLPANMELVRARFERMMKLLRERETLAGKIREQRNRIQKLESERRNFESQMAELLRTTGVDNAEQFEERHGILQERREKARVVEQMEGIIQAKVGHGESYARFLDEMRSFDRSALERQRVHLDDELSRLDARLKELFQESATLREKRKQMQSGEDMLKNQQELEHQKEALNEAARRWAVATMAVEMLDRAKQQYEKERRPTVFKFAESILSKITEGEYSKIIPVMDGSEVRLVDRNANSKSLLQLSRGTREQLYVALRLGMIAEYEKEAEPLPILMDDVFVNFDDERRDRLAAELVEFARERQVILLACHRSTVELFEKKGGRLLER